MENNNDIKVGDSVYWRIRIGFRSLTISGKVLGIDGDTLSIAQTIQNTYGKPIKKHINSVTKTKKQ